MKRAVLLIIITLFQINSYSQSTDSLLKLLDQTIAHRLEYDRNKEGQILQLKTMLGNTQVHETQFSLLGNLFTQYLPYNTDSAMLYTQKRIDLATAMEAPLYLAESQMNMAAIKNNTGMYKEALDILNNFNATQLTPQLKLYRFQLYRTIYGAMHDYAISGQEQQTYQRLTNAYRDSIIAQAEPGTKDYLYAVSDQMIIHGQCQEAVDLLTNYIRTIPSDNHDKAIVAYNLSQAWSCLGDEQQAFNYLTISAICDIKESIKEYISLWQLATMVYHRGDIDRAYNYLKCSLEDATFSKARLRTLKITEILPVIEKAYQSNREQQQRRMKLMMVVISLLLVFLAMAVVQTRHQLIKLKRTKSELSAANEKLQQLNHELAQYNQQVVEVNGILAETSSIKEEYIGRYMDLCSHYLDKMDEYRRTMYKKATTGKTDELVNDLKSAQFIKNELKDFYTNFDHTFLRLFPTFIDEFNALLNPEEQITLKPTELLNTELRIFALIRLGITDSEKIANFLRYSITTIYNYRTKMRNRAAGNRNDFDANVMKIGLIKKG